MQVSGNAITQAPYAANINYVPPLSPHCHLSSTSTLSIAAFNLYPNAQLGLLEYPLIIGILLPLSLFLGSWQKGLPAND